MYAKLNGNLLILLLLLVISGQAFAGNGSANANGNWGNPSSWLINGTARVPTCGDTVTIPAGFTITVTTQQIYGCATPLVIIVNGTLQFTTGNKLDLPCGSLVQVNTGGRVVPGNGGGNSNYIQICNTVYWNAAAGTLNGPVTLGGSPLPIKLLSFQGRAEDTHVLLNWSTATEVNNDYFIIERSANGTEWITVARKSGAGNSTQTIEYSTIDFDPINGYSYYRLRQTDFDGTTTISSPISVLFKSERKNVFVSAGVNDGALQIRYASGADSKGEIVIRNIIGEEVATFSLDILKGDNIYRLDIPSFPSGIYMVSLENGHNVDSKKVCF